MLLCFAVFVSFWDIQSFFDDVIECFYACVACGLSLKCVSFDSWCVVDIFFIGV